MFNVHHVWCVCLIIRSVSAFICYVPVYVLKCISRKETFFIIVVNLFCSSRTDPELRLTPEQAIEHPLVKQWVAKKKEVENACSSGLINRLNPVQWLISQFITSFSFIFHRYSDDNEPTCEPYDVGEENIEHSVDEWRRIIFEDIAGFVRNTWSKMFLGWLMLDVFRRMLAAYSQQSFEAAGELSRFVFSLFCLGVSFQFITFQCNFAFRWLKGKNFFHHSHNCNYCCCILFSIIITVARHTC